MIIKNIATYLENKGIAVYNAEKKISIGVGTLAKAIRNNANIGTNVLENFLNVYTDINPVWLLTGKGEMETVKNNQITRITDDNAGYLKEYGIPLIPVEAMAGISNNGGYQIAQNEIEDYFVVPSLVGIANCAFPVRGDSMAHRYCSGDYVMCKKIFLDQDYIQWNKPYILDTTQGSMLKRLIKNKSEDYFTCRSDNTAYADFEIPVSEIRNMALVLAVIRLE